MRSEASTPPWPSQKISWYPFQIIWEAAVIIHLFKSQMFFAIMQVEGMVKISTTNGVFWHWCQLHHQERSVIKGELEDAIGISANHLMVNNVRAQSFVCQLFWRICGADVTSIEIDLVTWCETIVVVFHIFLQLHRDNQCKTIHKSNARLNWNRVVYTNTSHLLYPSPHDLRLSSMGRPCQNPVEGRQWHSKRAYGGAAIGWVSWMDLGSSPSLGAPLRNTGWDVSEPVHLSDKLYKVLVEGHKNKLFTYRDIEERSATLSDAKE